MGATPATNFMKNLTSNKLKQTCIGHSIVQASRPRSVISLILFEVGVSLDSEFECESMINKLERLGYSITYNEITRFKQSSLQVSEQDLPESFPEGFTQWSLDNIDHNIATLDGQETFHGMGIISMTVPCSLSRLPPGHYSE